MQAIVTKYIPATNCHGSRIKATCNAGSITIPFPHESNEPHDVAAIALIVKLGWNDGRGRWYGGSLPDGRGNCYVCTYTRIKGIALKLPRRKVSKS